MVATDSTKKHLIAINVRLPMYAVICLKNEKRRTGIPMERLVLNALLGDYSIKTKKGQQP